MQFDLMQVPVPDFSDAYWDQRYRQADTPWDLGEASPTLMYLTERYAQIDSRILIPGGGRGYDLYELHRRGFHHAAALDWSIEAIRLAQRRFPELADKLIHADFFEHEGIYDLILEQTFFCALPPNRRSDYVDQMASLLKRGGILAGVWFVFPLTEQGPPFGGSPVEYRHLMTGQFDFLRFERCRYSVPERWGNEWLIVVQRK